MLASASPLHMPSHSHIDNRQNPGRGTPHTRGKPGALADGNGQVCGPPGGHAPSDRRRRLLSSARPLAPPRAVHRTDQLALSDVV
eukprot:4532691-Prymnesium_polylepis.1